MVMVGHIALRKTIINNIILTPNGYSYLLGVKLLMHYSNPNIMLHIFVTTLD